MNSTTNFQTFYRSGWLILMLCAVCLFSGCGKKTVATAESEFEANLMFDILHSNGFRVEKPRSEGEVKTWDVVIDEGWFGEGEAATAIQVLRDYGLPRPPEPQLKAPDSLGITSDREQAERQKRELQQLIERQMYTLPDVIRASVVVALPSDDILSLEKTPPTAAVTLVVKETQPKFTIEAVQELISGGVPKLKPENVKVVILQQALREIPLEKLKEKRRSNAIFAVGIGVLTLLALTLGTVLYWSKRRKQEFSGEFAQLPEKENADEFETDKRPLLNSENE